jgi:hypothetical protein
VDCASCHKSEVRNNQKFVRYSGLSFNNCNSCHKDAHKGRFGNNCEACHTDTEDSFNKIVPTRAFNHSVTGYALEGKHHEISCKKCHDNSNGASGSFQEFSKKKTLLVRVVIKMFMKENWEMTASLVTISNHFYSKTKLS